MAACASCGESLSGKFCSACGEAAVHAGDLRASHLTHDFVHELTHLDGKIWRTLRALVFEPGRLTREYRAGRRGTGHHENMMRRVVESPAVLDDLVRRIAERFSPDKIILFGSRARGDESPDSDIDLLMLFSEVADPNKRAAELYASLVDFPRPMDIVVSTSSRFERYRNVVSTVYWPASREGFA